MKPDPGKKAIIELMLQLPDHVLENPLFRRDLVDVSKGYFQEYLATIINVLIVAIDNNKNEKAKILREKFNYYLTEIDALLGTVPVHRMDRWIDMARSTVNSEDDKSLLEKNARMLVTVWGGNLNDYAHKEWSGLASGYYRGRWNLFFDQYQEPGFSQEKFDTLLIEWEYDWSGRTDLQPPGNVDPVEQVQTMMHMIE